MSKTPEWATELLNEVLTQEGFKRKVLLKWRESKRSIWSSGHANYPMKGQFFSSRWKDGHVKCKRLTNQNRYRIVVTAGSGTADQRQTLLHEVAHILTQGCHHGALFYRKCWDLYERYGIDLEKALTRERYYKEAVIQYERRGKPKL